MASKTTLVDLPNELLPLIFQYLTSTELLNTFSKLPSRRFQALLRTFITRLDISQESIEWIEKHIDECFTKYNLIALRLQMKDLDFISKYLSSTSIQYIEIFKWNFDFTISEETMTLLRRNMKKLVFSVPELDEDADLFCRLFQPDSQLEYLNINGCVLYLYNDQIKTSPQLKYLSVEVEGMEPVFLLLKHLINLQEIKVKIRSQECIAQAAPDTNGIKACHALRSVTFTGWIKKFDHLESFFSTFGSTIEYVFLNVESRYYTIDGRRLEHGLLDKTPRLSSLDLIIFFPIADDTPFQIETFQSLAWQKFNPVVYWIDSVSQQHTIFTFPYKSNHFPYLSADFFPTWISNRPIKLSLHHVRTLSFIPTKSIKLETCILLQEVFPNITTVELISWIINSLIDDEDEYEGITDLKLLADDLLIDTNIQLPSVRKLCIRKWSEVDDHRTFQRLLRLFPNLIDLELYDRQNLFSELLKHKYEADFVKNVLTRIKQLKIEMDWDTTALTHKEIDVLFPNAEKLIENYHSLE